MDEKVMREHTKALNRLADAMETFNKAVAKQQRSSGPKPKDTVASDPYSDENLARFVDGMGEVPKVAGRFR